MKKETQEMEKAANKKLSVIQRIFHKISYEPPFCREDAMNYYYDIHWLRKSDSFEISDTGRHVIVFGTQKGVLFNTTFISLCFRPPSTSPHKQTFEATYKDNILTVKCERMAISSMKYYKSAI